MKDIRSILRNKANAWRYKSWSAEIIDSYLSDKSGIRVLDVGCGKNVISNKPYVLGCDLYPSLRNTIGAAADNLPFRNNTFDMVVSAHCLEHATDVKKVMAEWTRVLKGDGYLWLILPHVNRTFDEHRALTTTDHILKDYEDNVQENDRTHWSEFRDKVLLSKHSAIPNEYIMQAKRDNFDFFSQQKLIHHHVWSTETFCDLAEKLGFQVLMCIDEVPGRHDSFAVIVRKNL